MAVGIRTKRRPIARRGPSDSNDIGAFMDECVSDLSAIATEINAVETEGSRTHLVRYLESLALRSQLENVIEDRRIRNLFDAANGDAITSVVNFRGFIGADYEISYGAIAEARRARVEPVYGQVVLPYNNVVNRIYSVSPDTGEVVLPGSIETTVTGYNETGGTVVTGTQRYAVNGNNQNYWIRKIRFPLESDVDYIEVDFQVNLPVLYTTHVNMVSIHPFPLGLTDIEEIKYSSTTADPTIDLPGFAAINCAGFRRWHFIDTNMTKIKVKLRQRHFIEENGFKVFYVGMQELLVQLVDFDRTANAGAGPLGPTAGNGVVIRVDAPTGYTFNQLTRFYSNPTWATVLADNKIYWRIYSDSSLSSLLWSSWTDPAPQTTPVDLSALSLSSVYVVLTLEWDDSNNVSPVVERFAMKYTVA